MFQSRIVVKTAVAGISSVQGASRRLAYSSIASGQKINDGLMKGTFSFIIKFKQYFSG